MSGKPGGSKSTSSGGSGKSSGHGKSSGNGKSGGNGKSDGHGKSIGNTLRLVPSVDRCLAMDQVQRLLNDQPRRTVVRAIRETLDRVRNDIRGGNFSEGLIADDVISRAIEQRTEQLLAPRVRRVINATGIILHTGLGRAVWSEAAREAVHRQATGPAIVEIDPETAERTVRTHAIQDLVCEITGAEAATVVNNNAAATMLILNTVADGKEVIVSRGELVEIGGSFRMPDVMTKAGAILRDVGTTNRTHLADFENAINENTGALFRAHTSNYKVVGFTKAVSLEELCALGKANELPMIDDVGSGALVDLSRFGFDEEPLVARSIAAGADLVCFSGDKLIGGPQAGFIAGTAHWVRQIEKNPLARAFRVDKATLAGIEATLKLFLDEETLYRDNPTMRMLAMTADQIRGRADRLAEGIRALGAPVDVHVVAESSQLGSGSMPTENLPTWVVALTPPGGDEGTYTCADLARRLRMHDPCVFPRVKNDEVLIDPRTLQPGEDQIVIDTVRDVLA